MAADSVKLMGEALRELREDRGFSRSGLSRATVRTGYEGVPESTIVAIETRPGYLANLQTMEALAEALGVSPDYWYEHPIALAKAAGQRRGRQGSS